MNRLRSMPVYLHSFLSFRLRWLMLFLACLSGQTGPLAQTTLFPGDLAVIGVNANNGFCSGFAGEDRISLVFFKDITPGTTFDLTDNGWERENAGFFGNQEGAFRFTRTGATIPAGTTVTIVLPAVGGQVRFAAPDSDWSLTRLSTQNTNVNLNTSGDQLIFMQGGTWEDGDTGFDGFLNNARYSGGRLLFAFNTKDTWLPLQDTSNDSKLPPAIGGCYQMTPATGSSDYLYYDGPADRATQLDWISRLSDPENWSTAVGCGSFPFPPAQIALDTSSFAITCMVCQSCQPFQEEISFSLPDDTASYTLRFLVNGDTVELTDYTAGNLYSVDVRDTTPIELLSVQDAGGCAIVMKDTLRLALQAGQGIEVAPPPIHRACDQGSGTSGFNLIAIGNNLRSRAGDTVIWYADSMRMQSVMASSNFQSNSRTLYAEVQNGLCTSGLIPVVLEVAPVPRLSALGDGFICPGECHEVILQMRGVAPFTLQYELLVEDRWRAFFLQSESGDTTLRICPDFGQATAIAFRSLSDQSCVTALSTIFDLPLYSPSVHTISDTLCPGEGIMVNGVRYDEDNPTGRDTLAGAGRNGCDSIIQVALVYIQPSAAVALEARSPLCRGETVNLIARLPDDQTYTLSYQVGEAPPIRVSGVQGVYRIPVSPTETTTYRLLRLQPEQGGCVLDLNVSTTIVVSDLNVQVSVVHPVGCNGSANGSLQAVATGGTASYQYTWNSGEHESSLVDLSAGTYSVSVSDSAGCEATASVTLEAMEPLQAIIRQEPAVCPEDEERVIIQQITGGSGSYRYSFDGTTFTAIRQFPVILTGLPPLADRLFIDDGGRCTYEAALEVISSSIPAQIDLGEERIIQRGDSVVLHAVLNFTPFSLTWGNAGTLRLSADSLTAVAHPERTTLYRLTATTGSGCILSQTVRVIVEVRPQIYYAPDAFSPNNDGRNDYFTLYGGADLQQIRVLRIFNRWGALVFAGNGLAPNAEEEGWNGVTGGNSQPAGVYIYQAELIDRGGQHFRVSGSLTLVR